MMGDGRIFTVGVVGCGIGRSHIAEGYRKHPDKFRVIAICDIDEARRMRLADAFAIPRRAASFDELLRMADVDVVDLCTPPGLHCEQVLAALEAGKEVVCEKPLACSLAEIDRMIAAERQARGRILPVYQYRFGNGVQKAKRIIDAGIARKPYLATVETAWKRGSDYYATEWRGRRDGARGGVMLSQAIHAHDLLTWLLGPVASVFARTATRVNPVEVEDCAVASLVMANGALAALSATLGSQKEISWLRLSFENVTFESAQTPYAPGDDPWQIVPASSEMAARIEAALAGHRFVPSGFEGLTGAYYEALASGSALPITTEDARRSLEIITALYHSAETGAAVALPIAREHPKYAGW
ncbi:MAG TPA: Gfo/Idh/MocA family oxidoreductase [Stellaceae bacterium]|jgi:predicted dehydrogenase|nr:Gfo/Idh/MocA family oxidoreductase [Stellaceae bacterium]